MLEDHSSRWSAAASPGGLIGLILTILSVMAVVASLLGLIGGFEIGVRDTILYVVLGVSTFSTFLLIYLLAGYISIRYRMDASELSISWGLWSESIPYDQIEGADPADEVLGDQNTGWTPYWPGYYVGTRTTDIGRVRVVSTLPPRHQILISRSDGEMFAISPERPMLFIEELARWHYQFHEAAQTPVQHPPEPPEQPVPDLPVSEGPPAAREAPAPVAYIEQPASQPEQFGYQPEAEQHPDHPIHTPRIQVDPLPPPPAEPEPPLDDVPSTEPPADSPRPAEPEPSPPPALPAPSGPVFGTTMPADYEPPREPAAETHVSDLAHVFVRGEIEDLSVPDPHAEVDTSQYEVWFPDGPVNRSQNLPDAYQQFADAGWTTEYQTADVAGHAPLTAPNPVILPEGLPRSQVLQPLTRVQRSEPTATSPAIRPTIHRDPVSLSFIGVGLVTTLAMALYILIQYQDMPASLTMHWNVDGLPGRIGEPQDIWVLPVIAVLVLFANVGLAWSIAQFDRFAARLMLSSTLVVHAVTWVALLMILQ